MGRQVSSIHAQPGTCWGFTLKKVLQVQKWEGWRFCFFLARFEEPGTSATCHLPWFPEPSHQWLLLGLELAGTGLCAGHGCPAPTSKVWVQGVQAGMRVKGLEWVTFFFKFIYLAGLGLGCSTQDLSLWCMDFPVVVCRLSCFTARGILVPQPGIKPVSPPLQGGSLTPGPPEKSPSHLLSMSRYLGCIKIGHSDLSSPEAQGRRPSLAMSIS